MYCHYFLNHLVALSFVKDMKSVDYDGCFDVVRMGQLSLCDGVAELWLNKPHQSGRSLKKYNYK